MAALDRHALRVPHRDVVGLADFSQPSGVARFHVVDVLGGRIVATRLVAHGRGSDPLNSGWVQRFSNLPGSNASSQGSFVTGTTYYGKHGLSRQLNGLDPENSNAASRAIVIHGADYVDSGMASSQGRVGRSLGCFAFAKHDIADMLRLLGEGRLLLAWK